MGQKSRFAGDNVMLGTKRKEYFMITRIIYHMRKEMIVEIRLNYIVLRRIASKRPLLFDPKITFFKTFSRNPWQFKKEIVTLWGRF